MFFIGFVDKVNFVNRWLIDKKNLILVVDNNLEEFWLKYYLLY